VAVRTVRRQIGEGPPVVGATTRVQISTTYLSQVMLVTQHANGCEEEYQAIQMYKK
jgi:hypothetical protein